MQNDERNQKEADARERTIVAKLRMPSLKGQFGAASVPSMCVRRLRVAGGSETVEL
jgi:hypothetical protein